LLPSTLRSTPILTVIHGTPKDVMHLFGIGKKSRKESFLGVRRRLGIGGKSDGGNAGKIALIVGAAAALAGGIVSSRRVDRAQLGEWGSDLRDRLEDAAARLRPARLRRAAAERRDLADLEDAVIEAFLEDGVLRRRGIDVGAISVGIIELSGSVRTVEESEHAVAVARQAKGVETVVNRLDLESEMEQAEASRRRQEEAGGGNGVSGQWHGRNVGMGRMRQSPETEPDRRDDSQKLRSRALDEADQDDAGENAGTPPVADRPAGETRASHDELDHQDPHRADNTARTLDEQPQDRNPEKRVGEGVDPGTELELEKSDAPWDETRRQE